jgi:Domain of unknown function (DUF4148)
MKKLTVVALALLAAGAAMADGLSREQVVAELQRARNAGELQAQQSENPDAFGRAAIAAGPGASRAAVLADLKQARDSGVLAAQSRESYGHLQPLTTASTKSRAEVVAELQRARANGELEAVNSYAGYAHLASLSAPAREAAPVLAGQPKAAQ